MRKDATPDARLAPVMHTQHGPFTRRQALDAGFTPAMIKSRLASGRWMRLYRSVFCEAAVLPSLERDASAAVLACGVGAAASHLTAGSLWDLDVPAAENVHVTVPAPSRARPRGLTVHETTRLMRSEAALRSGVRMTSPARTLLDLAGCLDPHLVELGLDRLWRRKLVHPRRLAIYLDDDWSRTRGGAALLRRLVRQRLGEGPSGSDVETVLLQLIRDARLPVPVRQYPVPTPFGVRYLDLAYPEQRIAIEIDGMDSRLDQNVFLDERVRQNLIEAQGWTFRRFGYAHVTEQQLWTIFTVAQALELTPVAWAHRSNSKTRRRPYEVSR